MAMERVKMRVARKEGAKVNNKKKSSNATQELAPIEPGVVAPAAEKRRPDPKPFQRAWGAAGAAASSALLAAIVGPMVAAAGDGGFAITTTADTTTGGGEATGAVQEPNYVYLQPGERAPEGAPVVQLDPINIVVAPQPGSTVVGKKPQRKVVYIYLQPGQTPPPGAIVQAAGSVVVSTPAPVTSTTPGSGGGSGGGSATPKPATPPPATLPPVATPRPTPAPTPPPTKPSGP